MNIIVCVKLVPDMETEVKLNETKTSIQQNGVKFIINPPDEYAVEEAVRIKEKFGGEITVVSVGPERDKQPFLTCLATGADKIIHIKTNPEVNNLDSFLIASILADTTKDMPYDIILCGNKAIDTENGAVAIQLAEFLNISCVSTAVKLEIDAGNKKAQVHRQIEGGEEIIECDLPALFTCQKGLNIPRYPTLPNIMKANKKPVEKKEVSECTKAKIEIISIDFPRKRENGRKLGGKPSEQVKELVKILKERGLGV